VPLATNVIRVVPPNGETAVVDILDTAGVSVGTAYNSDSNGDAVSLPATIATQTDFHLPDQGAYDVSVKVNGTEIAADGAPQRVNLVGGPPELVAPHVEEDERGSGGSVSLPIGVVPAATWTANGHDAFAVRVRWAGGTCAIPQTTAGEALTTYSVTVNDPPCSTEVEYQATTTYIYLDWSLAAWSGEPSASIPAGEYVLLVLQAAGESSFIQPDLPDGMTWLLASGPVT
jgi:hypothetical protein